MAYGDPIDESELAYAPQIGLEPSYPTDPGTELVPLPPAEPVDMVPAYEEQYLDPEVAHAVRSAWNLQAIANKAYRQHEHAQARTALLRSLGIFQQIGDTSGQACAYTNLGKVAYKQNSLTEARSYLQTSVDLFRSEDNRKGEAWSLNHLAKVCRREGDYVGARVAVQRSLSLFRSIQDPKGTAWSLENLAKVAVKDRADDQARPMYQEALELYEQLSDDHGQARCLEGLGQIAYREERYDDATELLNFAHDAYLEAGDNDSAGWSINRIGKSAYRQGQYNSAISHMKRCLTLFQQAGDKPGLAITLENMGRAAYRLGNYNESRALHQESLGISRNLNRTTAMISSLEQIARVSRKIGDTAVANEALKEARMLHAAKPEEPREATIAYGERAEIEEPDYDGPSWLPVPEQLSFLATGEQAPEFVGDLDAEIAAQDVDFASLDRAANGQDMLFKPDLPDSLLPEEPNAGGIGLGSPPYRPVASDPVAAETASANPVTNLDGSTS